MGGKRKMQPFSAGRAPVEVEKISWAEPCPSRISLRSHLLGGSCTCSLSCGWVLHLQAASKAAVAASKAAAPPPRARAKHAVFAHCMRAHLEGTCNTTSIRGSLNALTTCYRSPVPSLRFSEKKGGERGTRVPSIVSDWCSCNKHRKSNAAPSPTGLPNSREAFCKIEQVAQIHSPVRI